MNRFHLQTLTVTDATGQPEEGATFTTQDEAIAQAIRELRAEGEVGEVTIHTAGCAVDDNAEGCDCEPLVLVTGAEA